MKKEDGGAAFACVGGDSEGRSHLQEGMSLRDWFAGMAMQGMMARDSFDPGQATPQQRAALAYLEADALLKSRSE